MDFIRAIRKKLGIDNKVEIPIKKIPKFEKMANMKVIVYKDEVIDSKHVELYKSDFIGKVIVEIIYSNNQYMVYDCVKDEYKH